MIINSGRYKKELKIMKLEEIAKYLKGVKHEDKNKE